MESLWLSLVVQPHKHPRVAGKVDKQVAEVAHAAFAEHIHLVDDHAGLDELGGGGGEDAVPEQRHFFFERVGRGSHAIDPVGAGGVAVSQVGLVDVVAADEVVGQRVFGGGIEQALDGSLIAVF